MNLTISKKLIGFFVIKDYDKLSSEQADEMKNNRMTFLMGL